MALPIDLKKGMEGETEGAKVNAREGAAEPAGEKPSVHTPAPVSPKPVPETDPVPIPVTNPAPVPKPAPKAAPADTACLAKIERKLESLEKDLADLIDDFETYSCKAFNYQPILTRIDAAQKDLEKVMEQAKAQNEPDPAPAGQLEELIRKILEKQENNDRQLVRVLRDNANFQVQVRQQMQHELDDLREQQSGEVYNHLLKEIASMYADYQMLLEDQDVSPRTHKNLVALFDQMEELLMDYEAEIRVSQPGEVRPKFGSKPIHKIPTGDKSKHNTIAKSLKPGVVRGRLVLAQEFVDIYIFDETLVIKEEQEKPEPPVQDPPVTEVPKDVPPVQADPVPAAATEDTPVQADPAPAAPTEEPPVQTESEPAAPAEESPVESEPAAPAEESPVESEPAAPAEESPVESEPAAPAEESPAESEPAAPAEESPVESESAVPADEPPVQAEHEPAVPAEEPRKETFFDKVKTYFGG